MQFTLTLYSTLYSFTHIFCLIGININILFIYFYFYFPIFSLVGNANNKGVYVLSHQCTMLKLYFLPIEQN